MRYTITILMALHMLSSYAQDNKYSEEEKAVFQTISTVFDGMRAADSAMVHSVFTRDAQMFTVSKNKQGDVVLQPGSLQGFLNAVGTPHNEIWDEPIWDIEIRIDGQLAQVWTKYAFYLGKNFSHCGVDAFHLIKLDDHWKIFHLTDTRQRTGCEVPEEIKEARK